MPSLNRSTVKLDAAAVQGIASRQGWDIKTQGLDRTMAWIARQDEISRIYKQNVETEQRLVEKHHKKTISYSDLKAIHPAVRLPALSPHVRKILRKAKAAANTDANAGAAPVPENDADAANNNTNAENEAEAVDNNTNADAETVLGDVANVPIPLTVAPVAGFERAELDSEDENALPAVPATSHIVDKGKKRAREESESEDFENDDENEEGDNEDDNSACSPPQTEDIASSAGDADAASESEGSDDEGHGAGASEDEFHYIRCTQGDAPREGDGKWKDIKTLPNLQRWDGHFRCTLVGRNGRVCGQKYVATKIGLREHFERDHMQDAPGSFAGFLVSGPEASHACVLEPVDAKYYQRDTYFRHMLSIHLKPLTHMCTHCGEMMYLRDVVAQRAHSKGCSGKGTKATPPPVAGPSRKAGRSSTGPATKKVRRTKD